MQRTNTKTLSKRITQLVEPMIFYIEYHRLRIRIIAAPSGKPAVFISYDEIERFTAPSLLCPCAIKYSSSRGPTNNENDIFILVKQVSISLYKCRTDRRAESFLHLTSHNSVIHRTSSSSQ